MKFYKFILAPFVSYWSLVLAQQSCYWPNGSDANTTVSCNSTEDSVCCLPGDVCLSNGLCFGPDSGTVRSLHLSPHLQRQCFFNTSGKV